MQTDRCRWLAAGAALLAACGSGTPRGPSRAASGRSGPHELPVEVSLVPPSGAGAVLADAAPRVLDLDMQGARLTVGAGGSIEVAPELLGAGVAAVARAGDGFAFLDRGGQLWRASSFAARLEPVGSLPAGDFSASTSSPGRLAIVAAMDLFTSAGSLPLQRASLPPGTVLAAAFRDARRGAALLEGGRLAVTDDAGDTWRPVDAGGPVVLIAADARGLGGATLTGFFGIDDRGQVAPVEVPSGARPAETLVDREGRTALVRALPALAVAPFPTRARLQDGTVLWRDGARDLLRIRPGSGPPELLREVLPGDCYVYRWGAGVVAHCDGSLTTAALYRSSDGSAFERIGPITAVQSPLLASDGRAVAFGGGCPGTSEAGLCVLREANRWRPEPHPVAAERWSAPAGEWILGGRDETHVFALRLTTGAVVSPRLPAGFVARSAALSSDGARLVVIAEASTGRAERVLLAGAPGADLARLPLPAGALAVAFLDARRGIAVGAHAGLLWRTRDGAHTWEPLPAPVSGDPSRVGLLDGDVLIGAPVSCDALACWAGTSSIVVVRGWGPIAPVAHPARVVADPAAEREPPLGSFGAVELACTSQPEPRPAPTPWPARAPAGARAFVRAGAGVEARALVWRTGQHARWRVEWRGTDARGAFVSATREAPAPAPLDPDAGGDPRQELVLAGADRDTVVVGLCRDAVCRYLRGAPGATPTLLGGVTAPLAAAAPSMRPLALCAPAGDGRELLLWTAAEEAWTAWTDPGSGQLPSLARAAAFPGYRRRFGLAVEPGGRVSLVAERQAARGFVLVAPDAATMPRVVGDSELAVCSGPRAEDAISARFAGGPAAQGEAGALDYVRSSVVELSVRGACLRAVELAGATDTAATPASLEAREDGTLVGAGGGDAGWSRVRCTLGRAPRDGDSEAPADAE